MVYVPKHRGEPVIKQRITVVESERGWGRDEWNEDFDTVEEAQARIDELNARNKAGHAPDYYIMALHEIKQVTL